MHQIGVRLEMYSNREQRFGLPYLLSRHGTQQKLFLQQNLSQMDARTGFAEI